MENIWHYLRYSVRFLVKNPSFSIVIILTLALGIGANTAIYSVVNGVLFHTLPIREPGRVVMLHDQFPSWDVPRTKVSPLQFLEFSRRTDLFESSGALKLVNLNLAGREQAARLQVMEATSGFFSTLGTEPIFGRLFTSNDEQHGSVHVTLLSHGAWRRLFNGNPSAVGAVLQLDGESYEIIGVLPENLESLYPHIDVWIPAVLAPETLTEARRWYVDYTMVARLRRDISLAQARAAMKIVADRFNEDEFKFGVEIRPILDEEVGDVRGTLYILWGSVGLVLIVACSNIANLLLAKNMGRSREIAVRSALGAGRMRIVTQLLTENLLLSIVGGLSGLLLAHAFLTSLIRMAPGDLPRVNAIHLDSEALLFTLAVSFIALMFFGLVPSVLSARTDVVMTLKQGRGGGNRTGRRLRSILVTSEIALALVLLVGSGLFLRSFVKILHVEPGFDPANLLTMRISLPSAIYGNQQQLPAFSNAILDRVSAVPGVTHASMATGIPFSSDGYSTTFEIRNRQEQPDAPMPRGIVTYVTSDYFQTMKIPLLRGRFFRPADLRYGHWLAHGAVRIIDEALATRFWPNSDPLGVEIGNDGQWATIIGVVRTVHDQDLSIVPEGTIYIPGYGGTTLAVRTASNPLLLAQAVSEQVRVINKDVPIYQVETATNLVAASLQRRRFATILLSLFAMLAFFLALVGLYGLIAYLVVERAPEIGLRLALGAQHMDVFRLLILRGLRIAVMGVGLGFLGFALIRPLIASQLFGVGSSDMPTLVVVSFLLLGMAAVATSIPAWRAMHTDPIVTLRYD